MFPAAVADPVTAGLLHSVVGAAALEAAKAVRPAVGQVVAAAARVAQRSAYQGAASR